MIFGVILTLASLFILSVLRLFLTRFFGRSFIQVVPYLRPDGEAILAELMDGTLEKCLAANLSDGQFRREQLNRVSLADEYVGHRAHNAVVWQGWADTELSKARKMGDAELEALADALVVACAEFRIGASAIQTQLHMWQFKLILLPFARVPRISCIRRIDDFDLLTSYEQIKGIALRLAQACGGDYYERLREAM